MIHSKNSIFLNLFQYDSHNWIKNWTLLFNMTQRKCLFSSLTQRIFLFDTMYDSKNKLIVFGKYDSKNWTFFFNLTLRIEPFFLNVTQRIEHFSQSDSKNCFFFFFSIWLEELNPLFWICLNELNPFVDWLRELNPVFFFFSIWLKDLTLFKNMTFKNWTFWKYDSKDWTF